MYTGNKFQHGGGAGLGNMAGRVSPLAPEMRAQLQNDFQGASPEQQASMWGNKQLQPFLQGMLPGGADRNSTINRLEGASWGANPFDASQYGIAGQGAPGGAMAKPMMGDASGQSASSPNMGGANPQMMAQVLRRMNPSQGNMMGGQGGATSAPGTPFGGGMDRQGMGGRMQAGGGSFNEDAGLMNPGASGVANGGGMDLGGWLQQLMGGGGGASGFSGLNRQMYPPAMGASGSTGQSAAGQYMSPWGAPMQGASGWSGFAAPAAGASGNVWY